MPESGAYIGQGASADALRPGKAPGDAVRDLFNRHAKRFSESRKRILLCREVRRGLHQVEVDEAWTNGDTNLAEWIRCVLPERSMIPINLSNMLSAEAPVYTRNPRKESDRAIREADELESWLESMRRTLVPWEELIGKGVEDGEYAVTVMPSPACFEYAPDYMTSVGKDGIRKPDAQYDRDEKGRRPNERGYTKRSERASIAAWKEAYQEHLAATPPFVVRVIPATDCAPVLVRGRGRHRYECRGLVTRTLFEREELITRKFRWDSMDNREQIPRGFDQTNAVGQDGQLYLYEAYLIHVSDDGEETPFIARSVGGFHTWMDQSEDDDNSATINLKEEYGVTRLMVHYAWGLHHSDDDFDWRGVPILYPLISTILNVEGLTTAANAHAHDNAFAGSTATVDPGLEEGTYIDPGTNKFLEFKKPTSNEIVLLPGQAQPWAQAQVGDSVWRLIAQARATLQINQPDESQTGGKTDASGHAMVVSHELLESAKKQIKEGAREMVEWMGECFLELACGLARGEWKELGGYGVNVPAYEDVERTSDTGDTAMVSQVIEFKEAWVGTNYSVTADFPAVGNLADRQQKMDGWSKGAVTFREMRESQGDMHPETTRREIARDALMQSEVGQMTFQLEVAKQRQYRVQEMVLKAQLAGLLNKMGFPTDALAPELAGMQSMAPGMPQGQPQGAPQALGPGMPGGMTSIGNPAQQALGGAVSGEMGQASRNADAMAQMQVAPGGV